jgi:hypothetical protein
MKTLKHTRLNPVNIELVHILSLALLFGLGTYTIYYAELVSGSELLVHEVALVWSVAAAALLIWGQWNARVLTLAGALSMGLVAGHILYAVISFQAPLTFGFSSGCEFIVAWMLTHTEARDP